MAMDAEEIKTMIQEAIPESRVMITDLRGDGDHYAAEIISEAFEGKSRVQQHQMVYDCLLYTSPSPRDKRQSRMPSSA